MASASGAREAASWYPPGIESGLGARFYKNRCTNERKFGRRRHKSHDLRRHLGAPKARSSRTQVARTYLRTLADTTSRPV